LDYTVNDALFLYYTNRTGYRAGGVNTPSLSPSLEQFQHYRPQKVQDNEIGLHAKWQNGEWRGRFNIDVYQDKYTDLQLQADGIFPGSLPDVTAENAPSNTALTLNAGKATFEGVEFDGMISPFVGLNLSYGAAYLNARYESLSIPAVVQPFFSAAHFTGAPRWSYQGEIQYVLPVHPSAGGKIFLLADYYHIDSQYQGFALMSAYELTDFSVSWRDIGGKGIDLTVFLDNAFNTTYVQNVTLSQPTFGVFTGNYGPPRLYGARLRYSFGK
jgi:iron complex outermembrane receptor protein